MIGIDAELGALSRQQFRARIEALCEVFAAGAPLSIAPALERGGPEFRAIFVAALSAVSILSVAFVSRLAALAGTECPRCAQRFFEAPWAPLVFARRCAHCDLALPRAGSAPPEPSA